MKLSGNDLRAIEDVDFDLDEEHDNGRQQRRRNDRSRLDERMKGEDRRAMRRQKEKRQHNEWD